MQRPLIPLSLLRDLRCRQCQNFVTCGPVYVVPDESILCGRCRHLAKDIYPNISYEALASMFIYPCYNWENHCSMTLLWNESLQHEEECNYSGFCKMFWNHPRAYFKGKREIPFGEVRLTPVPEHLLEYIKCVLCESYLSCEPVYIQSNGRNICHRCINANGVPPNCLRNLAYEKLSTILIFPCIYRNRGCPTRLKFGRNLWQHEADCSYGQTPKKIVTNPYKKERGVIKTHSGHYYGTITPNVALFAPPTQESEVGANKELLKSLKKQQERRFVRADEIGTQFETMNSEDGSIYTEDSEGKDKSPRASESISPTRLEDTESKQRRYNYPYPPPPAELGNFPNRNGKPPQLTLDNYQQNLLVAQVHQEDYPSPRISRSNSYKKTYYYQYSNGDHVRKRSEESLSPKLSSSRKPLNNIDSNILASQYPAVDYPRGQTSPTTTDSVTQTPVFTSSGLHTPTFNGGWNRFSFNTDHPLMRTDSTNSNRELIDELKIKLMKNKSVKQQTDDEVENGVDSPYKECQNLEEILQAHDRIVQ